jgi:hypothetical protein
MMCGYVVCVLECCGSVNTLFYILAPTCFGSSLPSSGSFLDPSELLEIQIEWVVYHIMCGYVVYVHGLWWFDHYFILYTGSYMFRQ